MRDLTAARWRALAPLLGRVRPRTGRGFADLRRSFAGVAFRLRTGIPWRDLPPRFGPWPRAGLGAPHRRRARPGGWDALAAEARAAGRPDLAECLSTARWCAPTRRRRGRGGLRGARPLARRAA